MQKLENPSIAQMGVQGISEDVLLEKYAKNDETSLEQVQQRVANALADVEQPKSRKKYAEQFLWAMQHGFIPAGRINSAAGAGLQTTLINCFVVVFALAKWFFSAERTCFSFFSPNAIWSALYPSDPVVFT